MNNLPKPHQDNFSEATEINISNGKITLKEIHLDLNMFDINSGHLSSNLSFPSCVVQSKDDSDMRIIMNPFCEDERRVSCEKHRLGM